MDTFTFKYLEIPNIKDELLLFFKNNPIPDIPFQVLDIRDTMEQLPLIKKWFLDNKVFVSKVAHATNPPRSETAIHTDHGNCALAVNFPLHNCTTAKTIFYQCEEKYFKQVTGKSGLDYFDIPKEHATYLDHYVMTKPVLINLHRPHTVVNDTDDYRHCLSFRFFRTPLHLLKI
jgi:hypothetical protein